MEIFTLLWLLVEQKARLGFEVKEKLSGFFVWR